MIKNRVSGSTPIQVKFAQKVRTRRNETILNKSGFLPRILFDIEQFSTKKRMFLYGDTCRNRSVTFFLAKHDHDNQKYKL